MISGQTRQHICKLITGKPHVIGCFLSLWLVSFYCGAQTTPADEWSQAKYESLVAERVNAGDIIEAVRLLCEVADKCRENKDYNQALQHYNRAIEMVKSEGNEAGIAEIQGRMGVIYYDLGEFETSLKYFREYYQYMKARNEKTAMLTSLLNISVVLDKLKSYDNAIKVLDEALAIADELNNLVLKRSCYGLLSGIHSKTRNADLSSDYLQYRKNLYEILNQPQNRKDCQDKLEQANMQIQLAAVKQQHADLELQQVLYEKNQTLKILDSINKALLLSKSKSEKLIDNLKNSEETAEIMREQAEAQLKTVQLKTYYLYVGLGFVLVVAFIIYFSYIQKRLVNKKLAHQNAEIKMHRNKILEQNAALENAYNEIRQKNEDITRSIDYAEYIQKAFLATPQELLSRLPDSFIYMKPCAIVSGDFFWCKRIDNKLLVACADCTGHGVPGAFMSLISSNLLTQIADQGLVSPEQILNVLSMALYHALRKHNSKLHSGLDIAMYCIDYERKELTFSGAKMPDRKSTRLNSSH